MSYDPRKLVGRRRCGWCCAFLPHAKPSRVARGVDRFCDRECFRLYQRSKGKLSNYAGKGEREHRLIARRCMTKEGERLPRSDWDVHHLNGQKRDNRPRNLVVCSPRRAHSLLECNPDAFEPHIYRGPLTGIGILRLDPPEGMWWCSSCGLLLESWRFGRDKRRDTPRSICNPCRAERA